MGDASRIGGESGVVAPGVPDDAAEVPKLLVVTTGDDHVTVGDGEHLIGHDRRVRIAEPGRSLARYEVVERLVAETRDLRVE